MGKYIIKVMQKDELKTVYDCSDVENAMFVCEESNSVFDQIEIYRGNRLISFDALKEDYLLAVL